MALAIRETEVAGERFMTLGGTLLVASKSKAGEWYRIENATCTCPSWKYRGACRHVVAAAQLEETETDAVTVERTTLLQGGWRVLWGGFWHGGVHSRREDAEGHAQGLREAPDWDYAEWLERHGYGIPTPPVPTTPTPVRAPALPVLTGPRLRLVKESWL